MQALHLLRALSSTVQNSVKDIDYVNSTHPAGSAAHGMYYILLAHVTKLIILSQ